jgi:hypothetical protein
VTVTRLASALLLLLLAAALPLPAAEAAFVHVWPGWRDAESFERLSEYFGGPENTGRDRVLRTAATVRDGFYFLVRVRPAAALPGARFELHVVRPDAPEPKVFTFPADLPAREIVCHLGLTGPAWPGGRKASPLAWKLTLRAADGRTLAEEKSFLWEKPAK